MLKILAAVLFGMLVFGATATAQTKPPAISDIQERHWLMPCVKKEDFKRIVTEMGFGELFSSSDEVVKETNAFFSVFINVDRTILVVSYRPGDDRLCIVLKADDMKRYGP